MAVDVGYGQLIWRLQNDERVQVLDRTNVRHLTPEDIGGPVELVVADLSFISLRLVLPALVGCVVPEGDLVLLVKPQFEVGREQVGRGGVVRDPERAAGAIRAWRKRPQRSDSGFAGWCGVRFPVQQAIWSTCSGWPHGRRSRRRGAAQRDRTSIPIPEAASPARRCR